MTFEEILNLIQDLARSQGFYGRLYESIMTLKDKAPDLYEELRTNLETHKFVDAVDFITFIEG